MSISSIEASMTPKEALRVLKRIIPWRSETKSRLNHKGVHGRIGIVGGARDYAGAPFFASMSAMRLGADLACVICSRDAGQVIKSYSPDLIVTPLLDHPDDNEFLTETDCLLKRLHALVIGPGLGREPLILNRAVHLMEQAKARSMPLILDADSLIMVNENPSIIQSYNKALLTPNRIELQRLLEKLFSPEKFDLNTTISEDVKTLVRRCSNHLNVAILAKGPSDLIYGNDGGGLELFTNELTGSYRRCGGQGDITSGLAAVYAHWIELANKKMEESEERIKNPLAWAGFLAAVTTRRANDLAYNDLGGGMLASDMVNKVHLALQSMLNEKESPDAGGVFKYSGALTKDEISRYARQMIMDEFGPVRQANLRKSSALIIGAGGLGCPAAVYLGAAGIGSIGVVDDDRVEASNLHRQILHNMDKVGMLKTESIKQAVEAINPNVQIIAHSCKMNRYNAVDLVSKYDIILDCTDNLLTRYMISDACVVAKKPLVSGAALKMDGQLTVYNFDQETPCFRCLFPEPPPPNAVGSCSENGVMGVLPGIIGVQQALEAIKIGAGDRPACAGKMLLFDGVLGRFRHITLGKRKEDCRACGKNSELSKDLIDYEKFCNQMCKGEAKPVNILDHPERISVEQYSELLKKAQDHILVDVRPREQSNISRFSHALQMPVNWMIQNPNESIAQIKNQLKTRQTNQVYVVCRKGFASQRGVRVLQDLLKDEVPNVVIKDIIGGMTTWACRIDPEGYACL